MAELRESEQDHDVPVAFGGSRMACTKALVSCSLTILAVGSLMAAEVTPPDEFVETRGRVDTGSGAIEYTARAGMLPLYENDTGELMARMFIIAYVADPQPGGPPRPLTFIWNGGPGSSSSELHLIGFGPRGLETPPAYPDWIDHPPDRIVDRPETWLTASDLVFVDPIGTGYSRATRVDYRNLLYTRRGDIEAVAEAIRLYRTRFDAWDQPVFIAGESYGTTRAMGVANALERRRADIAGVILMSGEYEVGQDAAPELIAALNLPLFAAAAHYHGRLPPDLQSLSEQDVMAAAETWARQTYAPALERLDELTDAERDAIRAGVSRYSGVAKEFVNSDSLELEGTTFADRLLDDQGLELGNYDYRMTFPRRDLSSGWAPTRDPSLLPVLDLMQGTSVLLIRYLRNTLGYKSDLLYRGPFGGAFHPGPLVDVTHGAYGGLYGIYSDWMTLMFDRSNAVNPQGAQAPQGGSVVTGSQPPSSGTPPPELPPLEQAMLRNPHFLVWNIRGRYDISCAALDEEVAQTAEALRNRVRNSCYAGGHMMYTDPGVRREMQADFAKFVRDGVAAQPR